MKVDIQKVRTVAIVAHGGSGKTSLTEAMLFDSGATTRLGKVEDGTTTTDYDPDEIRRKISLSLSLAPCQWQGYKINLIDTPGFADFIGEVRSALRVADGGVVVLSAVSGVEVQSEIVWRYTQEKNLPKLIFINKMDRENADFDKVLEMARQLLGSAPIAAQIPLGAAETFKGVVDLVKMKAIVFSDSKQQEQEIPAELEDQARAYREKLIEAAAESDDELLEKYLEGTELTEDEIKKGLRAATLKGNLVPIFCGSANKNIGVPPLLDAIIHYLPSPLDRPETTGVNLKTQQEETRKAEADEPFSGLVFKTMVDPYIGKLNFFRVYSGTLTSDSQIDNSTKDRLERIGQIFIMHGKRQEQTTEVGPGDIAAVARLQETATGDTLSNPNHPIVLTPVEFPSPVISAAIEPKTKGDEDKLSSSLHKLTEEDPTLAVRRDHEIKQTIVSGMGETHLEIITERLKRKFDVEARLEKPKIPYKETILSSAKAQGKYKKQSGGRGQYGDAWVEVEPLERGKGFEFVNKIFGGAIPRQYIPAVEKGVKEGLEEGLVAGYPVVDVKVTLYDGTYHQVDSSEMAFKIAGSMAFRNATSQANPVLLEPVMNVEVVVPENYLGDIMGDLNSKRGKILGMEPVGEHYQSIKALLPLAEISKYANDLRSITQGRGTFKMEFSHYEQVPAHLSQKLAEEIKR